MAIPRASQSKQMTGDKKKKKKKKSTAPLGKGDRFAAISKSIQKSGKSKKDADAITASAGRKKYGKKKFAELSAQGRRKQRRA
jgi:hypothetical protein